MLWTAFAAPVRRLTHPNMRRQQFFASPLRDVVECGCKMVKTFDYATYKLGCLLRVNIFFRLSLQQCLRCSGIEPLSILWRSLKHQRQAVLCQ